jgi:hypothetical protein
MFYVFWVCVCSLSYLACKLHISALFCLLWPVRLHHIFPRLANGTIFRGKWLNIKCEFWLSLQMLSETFLIIRIIQRDVVTNVQTPSREVPGCVVRFNETWIFLTYFRKILRYQISSSVEAELFHEDGRANTTKLTVTFCNAVNAPHNISENFITWTCGLWHCVVWYPSSRTLKPTNQNTRRYNQDNSHTRTNISSTVCLFVCCDSFGFKTNI